MLLLHGKTGAGKTILFSNATEFLDQAKGSTKEIAVAFFYCTCENNTSQEPTSILGSYLVQLLTSSPQLYKRNESTLRDRVPKTVSELLELLERCCQSFKEVYLCLDALNENLWGQEIVKVFNRLIRDMDNIYIFVTSNRTNVSGNTDIRKVVKLVTFNPQAQLLDFDMYIAARVAASPILTSLSEDLQNSISKTLLRDSDGM